MQEATRNKHVKLAAKLSKSLQGQIRASRDLALVYWEIGGLLNKTFGVTVSRGTGVGSISDGEWAEIEEIYATSQATLQNARRFNKKYQTRADLDAALAVDPAWTHHIKLDGQPSSLFTISIPMALVNEISADLGDESRAAVKWFLQNKVTASRVISAYQKFQASQEKLAALR